MDNKNNAQENAGQLSGKNNALQILQIIFENPDIIKSKLAKLLGVSTVTVHNIMNTLTEKGICVHSGITDSSGGRRAMSYRVNPDFGYIIGIHMSRSHIYTSVFDLGQKLLYKLNMNCDLKNRKATFDIICESIKKAVSYGSELGKNCLCVSVIIPGRADEAGNIIQIPDANVWDGFEFSKEISALVSLPVYVENDNNAYALSAKWLGYVKDCKDFVFLSVTEGVGAGVLYNGRLYKGSGGGAEIGHIIIEANGTACSCGNNGCVQAYISDQAVLARLSYLLNVRHNEFYKTFPDIIEVAKYTIENNCEELMNVFAGISSYFAVALQNIVKIFNPEIIIINNNWITLFPEVFESIKRKLFRYCRQKNDENLKFIIKNGGDVLDKAVFFLGLENILNDTHNNIFFRVFRAEEIMRASSKDS